MPRSAALHAVLLLLVLTAAAASAATATRRLLEEVEAPAPAPDSLWVPADVHPPRRLAKELVPLFNALQSNKTLLTASLTCAETTGIASIASELPEVLLNGVAAYHKYGFCALDDLESAQERLSYMLSYSLSLFLRGKLQDEFVCEGMEGLPEQCFIGTLIDDAVASALRVYNGEVFCNSVESDATLPVEVMVLRDGWEAAEPQFKCSPRGPPGTP